MAPVVFLQSIIPPNLVTPIMLVLMFGVFYLFILRPQTQRQKKQDQFQSGIKRGDRVVTSAGIVGRVSKLDTEQGVVTIETGKNVYLDFTLGSVSRDLTVAKFGEASNE